MTAGRPRPGDAYRSARPGTGVGYHVPRFAEALKREFGDLGGHADGQDDAPPATARRGRPPKRVA